MPVHEFKVEMKCAGCATAIEKVLSTVGAKIEKVSIDLAEKTVQVTSSMTSDELLEIIKKTGRAVTYVGVKE